MLTDQRVIENQIFYYSDVLRNYLVNLSNHWKITYSADYINQMMKDFVYWITADLFEPANLWEQLLQEETQVITNIKLSLTILEEWLYSHAPLLYNNWLLCPESNHSNMIILKS